LRQAGVEFKDSASKASIARKLSIAELSHAEAKAVHDFIDARVDVEPSRANLRLKPLVSKQYADLFNPVDRLNRLVYELYNDCPIPNYSFRALLYAVTVGLINLWSWISSATASRQNTILRGKRDVSTLKNFIALVLSQIKASIAYPWLFLPFFLQAYFRKKNCLFSKNYQIIMKSAKFQE
jgi:hypothetical protein